MTMRLVLAMKIEVGPAPAFSFVLSAR